MQIRTHNWIPGALAGLLILAWTARVSRAGEYHVGQELTCSDCHVMHASKEAETWTPAEKLLKSSAGQVALCMGCHDGTDPEAPDIVAAGTAANPSSTVVTGYASVYGSSAGFFQSDYLSAANSHGHDLAKSKPDIFDEIMASRPKPKAPPSEPGVVTVGDAGPEGTTGAAGKAQYLDETRAYDESAFTALLMDIGDAKLGAVTYKKHFHDAIETKYALGDTGRFVDVRLVDYRKVAIAKKFVGHYNPDLQESTFQSLPAFTHESEFRYVHLDVAVGRFGLFLRAPKDHKAGMEALAAGIIGSLK